MNYEFAVETKDLTKRFGTIEALRSVTLQVPRGCVFGILGANGAGKSTMLKMLMGHLHPTSGNIQVLGHSLQTNLLEIRERVGYVSEDRYLYDWMTVSEIIRFTKAFHHRWDDQKASQFKERFALPDDVPIKRLSRGNRARLCLLLALSHNPELIILDEPTSGLDPIVRKDFIENIAQEIALFGRTVLFSTHNVEEVERIADYVSVLDGGKLICVSRVDALKASFKRIRVFPNTLQNDFEQMPGVVSVRRENRERILTVSGKSDELCQFLQRKGITDFQEVSMSLEEIFLGYVSGWERR